MERPKVQDMEGSVTCPMREAGCLGLPRHAPAGGAQQQRERSQHIEELLKIGMMVAEAQMKEIVDEAPNKDMSAMVPTVKQHITIATQMEEGNSKQGQMVRFVKVDTSRDRAGT